MFNFLVQQYKFSAIVNYNGETYFVDACDTGDCGHELMIFKAGVHKDDIIVKNHHSRDISILDDKAFKDSIDWGDLYVERATTKAELEKVFDRVVSNIGAYLDPDDEVLPEHIMNALKNLEEAIRGYNETCDRNDRILLAEIDYDEDDGIETKVLCHRASYADDARVETNGSVSNISVDRDGIHIWCLE